MSNNWSGHIQQDLRAIKEQIKPSSFEIIEICLMYINGNLVNICEELKIANELKAQANRLKAAELDFRAGYSVEERVQEIMEE